MPNQTQVHYSVDPSVHPSNWPGHEPGAKIVVHKIDVIYVNVNAASDFRMLRTGTNEHIHHVVTQVTKHIAHDLYNIMSFNATEHSCVVVFSTEKSKEDLSYKNGFPWDSEDAPQPRVIV